MKTTKKQRVKSSYSVRFTASSALAAGVLSVAMSAHAAPVLDHVVAGGVSVDNITGVGNVIVTQTTNQGVVNWNNFNIGATESTQFVQPSASSVTLNRVTGDANPTQILGNLTANGKIAIVNPNGVLFGSTAKVDVAGLVATTADMSSDDFMAGGTTFSKDGAAGALVENRGSITAQEGGLVALVAPNVKNSGVITARKGTVLLGGAKGVTVDLYGDGLVNFALDGQSGGNNAVDVTSTGKVIADGGHVYLAANNAAEVVDHVINMQGYVQADTITESDAGIVIGNITVDSGTANSLIGGTLRAAGGESEKGGNITLRGKSVALHSADRDVIVNAQGGAQGGNVDIQATHAVDIGAHDATNIVRITAAGKDSASKGGSVKIGAHNASGTGKVTVRDNGILNVDGDTKGGSLNVTADHIVFSGAVVTAQGGDVTFDSSKVWINDGGANGKTDNIAEELVEKLSKVGADVTLIGADSIQVNNLSDNKLRGGSGDITLKTTSDTGAIRFNDKYDALSTSSGDVSLAAASGGIKAGRVTTESGNISLRTTDGGDIIADRLSVTAGEGAASITANAAGDLTVENVSVRVTDAEGESSAVLKAAGDIKVHNDIEVIAQGTSGDNVSARIDVDAGKSITVADDLNAFAESTNQATQATIALKAGEAIDVDHTEAHAYSAEDALAHVTMDAAKLDIRDDIHALATSSAEGASAQGFIDVIGQVTAYVKDYVTDFEATTDVNVTGDIHAVSTSDKDVGDNLTAMNANQALRLLAGNAVQVTGSMTSLLADLVVRAGAGGIALGDVATGQDISGLVSGQEEGAFEPGSIDLRTAKGSNGDIVAGLLSIMGTQDEVDLKVVADGDVAIKGINAQVLDLPDPGSQNRLDVLVRAGGDVDINGDVIVKSWDDQGATRHAENTVTIEAGKALSIDGDVLVEAKAGNRGHKGDKGESYSHVKLSAGEALTVGDVLVSALGGDNADARLDIVSGGTVSLGDVGVVATTTEGLNPVYADAYLGIVAAGTEVEDDSNITYKGANPYAIANDASETSRYDAVDETVLGRAEISIVKKSSSSSSSGSSSSGGSSSGGSSSGGSSSGGSSSGGSSSGGSSSGGSSSGGSSSGGVTPSVSALNLNELALLRDSGFDKDRYSFFGETMGNPYYYGNTNVNLTLLSGKRSAPALSGLSAEALGGIAPAAGGAAGEGDCGNNYLDAGFSTGFNNQTCREEAL